MKILLFHPSLVPPKDYGGVERVILWLAQGLLERGHSVWVAAYPGSRLPQGVQLLEICPRNRSAFALLEKLPKGVDAIHFMAPPEVNILEQLPCAGLVTVHGNAQAGELFAKNTVFLSSDHAKRHGAEIYVYNGLDPKEYRFEPKLKEANFLFLSKTSWRVKNLAGAMRFCSRARAPLWIAGGRRPIRARLRSIFSRSFHWMGPVNGAFKSDLLARARALLFPVLWPEPFGLAVIEALVSGTPVLASNFGSLPELVPGDVGCLLDPYDEETWVRFLTLSRLPWDPERCRSWVLEKFHYQKMAESYEKLYKQVSSGVVVHSKPPIASGWRNS